MSTLVDIAPVGAVAADLLASLHAASFCRPGDERWSAQAFADVLGMPGSFCLLASVAGRIRPEPVGFCACRVAGPESELLSLGVLPTHRRAGTARQLILRCMGRCVEGGAREMYLEVAEDNPSAQLLYRSLGFFQVGRRKGYYLRLDNLKVDALTMRRDLR
ncbi:N-acetyltransferase [Emcibacter sp. SYSU 3D8]|uniref:N-acetyltransferase n=1 Tax=Emcibacter sp. SYSU 3D8 TaxID=3133969 RepID=UPI0031FE7EDF